MPSSSSGASEPDALALTISPYGYVEWRGPRAKLEATGLIPSSFKWPERIDYAHWHANGFEFALRRCRPDGLHGPMRYWMKYDYWFVRRTMPGPMGKSWRIHEPYRDLGDILSQTTRAGEALWTNYSKVHANDRIEDFEAQLIPRPTKRGRVRKVR